MSAREAKSSPESGSSSRGAWFALAVAAIGPVVVLLVLWAAGVPLGRPGQFVYLYSPIVLMRLLALPGLLLLAGMMGAAMYQYLAGERLWAGAAVLLIVVGMAGAGAWSFTAPPEYRSQCFFNMQSPSHDGAFLDEARYARSVGVCAYLRDFAARARTPQEQMRGTRVISNPPGTTLIAAGTLAVLDAWPGLAQWIASWGANEKLSPRDLTRLTQSLAYALVLHVLWLLAFPVLFAGYRQMLDSGAALVLAVVTMVTPATLLFTPGKDPAQLLTAALPLCFWLVAWRRGWIWPAAVAGALATLVCVLSLVHVWLAAIVLVATLSATAVAKQRAVWLCLVLPAIGAGVLVGLLLWQVFDLNIVATSLASARSQAEVTRGADAMPLVWQMLGVPLFLLFAGPAIWFALLRLPVAGERDDDARFGTWLLVGSVVVMVATVGFTNIETPRLWIPFTPLVLFGAALRMPLLRRRQVGAAWLLTALVFAQFVSSGLQWSLMDMREAETRLLVTDQSDARFFE